MSTFYLSADGFHDFSAAFLWNIFKMLDTILKNIYINFWSFFWKIKLNLIGNLQSL